MKFSGDHVELFLAVLDHGSFSAAARALGRVPSAVSMGVANMEAELGLTLFDRSNREVRPTASGEALAPHARLVAGQLSQLRVHAQELSQGLESRLSIAVTEDISPAHYMPAIHELATRYPLLDVEVSSAPQDDAMSMLRNDRVSLCLAFGGLQVSAKESFQFVAHERLVATVAPSHPALKPGKDPIHLEDLVDVRQVFVASRDQPLSDARPLVGANRWRTDSLGVALAMVEAGIGWGNFPLSVVEPLLATRRLIRLEFRNTRNELRLPVHVIWLKDRPLQKAAQQLVGLLATSL